VRARALVDRETALRAFFRWAGIGTDHCSSSLHNEIALYAGNNFAVLARRRWLRLRCLPCATSFPVVPRAKRVNSFAHSVGIVIRLTYENHEISLSATRF